MARLNRILTCALVVCAALLAADHKDVARSVALSPHGSVRIETHRGSIRISTWDRSEVDIQADIEAGPFTSRRRFDGTDVAINSSPDSVSIQTKHLCCISGDGSNPEVHYTIRMPSTAGLSIRDHASDVEITGLSAPLDLETHRGDAHVNGLNGPLQVRTHRGEIHVDFAAFTGSSRIETHRGTVELLLPRDSRFDVRTDLVRRASLESDFPMMARLAGHRVRNLEGAVNGGGPVLQINTDRGRIRVRSK